VPTVSSLPGSPANGDEVYYQFNRGDGTNAYWHLRYNSGTTYWDFLGGPGIRAFVGTAEATASTTYVSLTTAGPSVTTPLQGDYDLSFGARISATAVGVGANMSYDTGTCPTENGVAPCATDANAIGTGTGWITTGSRTNRETGVAASVTFATKYRDTTGSGSISVDQRWIQIIPIRVK
jgi:hypothetical protein